MCEICPHEKEIEKRFDDGSKKMADLDENVKSLEGKIDTLLDVFDAFKGAFRVLGWLAIAAKWVIYIGSLLAMVWGVLHFGGHVK